MIYKAIQLIIKLHPNLNLIIIIIINIPIITYHLLNLINLIKYNKQLNHM